MRYIVDIDNTICTQTENSSYEDAKPFVDRIAKINQLFDDGHQIIYWTARGQVSGIDWTVLTHGQLSMWGCKYHELWMNKPAYDVWVDDKAEWLFE